MAHTTVNLGGRPSVLTYERVRKLVSAQERGFSVRKSCELAGVSHEAYYYHLRNNGPLAGLLIGSEEWVITRARLDVAQAIHDGDVKTCKWYLERKVPEEYGRSSNERRKSAKVL